MDLIYRLPMVVFWSIILILAIGLITVVPALVIFAILKLPPQAAVSTLLGALVLYARFGSGQSRPH